MGRDGYRDGAHDAEDNGHIPCHDTPGGVMTTPRSLSQRPCPQALLAQGPWYPGTPWEELFCHPKSIHGPSGGTCPQGIPSIVAVGRDARCCQRMGPGQSWQEVAWGQPGCPGGSRSSESAQTLRVVPASSLTQGCRRQAALCQVCDQLETDSEPGWMAEAGGRSLLWSPAHGRSHFHTRGHLASLGTGNGGIGGRAEVAQP